MRAYDPWFGKEVTGTVTRFGPVDTLDGAVRLFVWTDDRRHIWIAPHNVREVITKGTV